MDITVTDNKTGEVMTLADQRQKTIESFRHLINNLPWDDINNGRFHPQAGCTTVAEVRDNFIALGCDPELLLEGAEREYVAVVKTEVTLTYTFSAQSEELAEDHVHHLLDSEYLSAITADEVDLEVWSADITVEVND